MSGRRSRVGYPGAVERLVAEIIESEDPVEAITRRVREGWAIPGFQSAEAARTDARVAILIDRLRSTMAADAEFQKLEAAARAVHGILELAPTFAYLSTFAWRKIGLRRHDAPFLLGRSAGWIAHAMEQHQAGERRRVEFHYRGPLPSRTFGQTTSV